MNWRWSTFDLQKKAICLACLGMIVWVFILSLVLVEVKSMNEATMDLEVIQDLYDAILEMRRYEKNFLLYQGQDNLAQTIQFYDKARQIYSRMKQSTEIFDNIKSDIKLLNMNFEEYGREVSDFKEGDAFVVKGKQERIRASGSRMIDLVKKIAMDSRQDADIKARRAVWLPLSSSGAVILLFFFGLAMINRKIIRPLVLLEKATEKIGRGDFSPICHPGRIESEVDRLVFAFNRMVEELDARQEQIIHSRKIASLGTLVSGVAHELNNPINNIILTIDSLVGKRKIPQARREKLLDDILNQAIRASGIVKNLLDFSRAEVSAMQNVNMEGMLNEIFKLTKNELAMKNIVFNKHVEDNLPLVLGNRQALQQVFFNLVINSIQAMSENGELTVTMGLDENKRINVVVKDTGEGILEEDLPHIFDPFFTTKTVGKGTGLGLSVSYGIMKKHGGRIMVESTRGEGTVFTVTLPCKTEEEDE